MNTTATRPDLTDAEIDEICAGLMQSHAKCRYLRSLGLRVERRPNGRPLVARSEWERRLASGQAPQATPAGNAPKWRVAA
ncbi:DUF4224 domain-containing protein [Hydrogenophaga aromaticivorans]|uniref:DUF4224 domain-containing protein n=1 Tax=Hydrogenophaga aromaticivorans TaxID=2610898 RepID=UPI001B372FF4|nr:DUF4224 domain-containing protein [Hydrogenophaga aromaticivorans]MBQ0917223.1 DUF4224 domain-containing protein [Hydrogenophaga aromaticivorans]